MRAVLLCVVVLVSAGCAAGIDSQGNFTSDPASTVPTVSTVPPVTVPMERVADVPGAGYQGGGQVSTICDHGNRIYVFDAQQRAGIAVIPDRTCPGGAP
jgi:hypothetical protein